MNYEKQAIDFLEKTRVIMTIDFMENGLHFDGDTETRDIYKVSFEKGSRKISVKFGNSILNSQHYIDKLNGDKFTLNGKGIYPTTKSIYPEKLASYSKDFLTLTKGKKPTAYDVLACLEKYGHSSFEDFCDEHGYDNDSRKALDVYMSVTKEYDDLCKIWGEKEMELLREIQ